MSWDVELEFNDPDRCVDRFPHIIEQIPQTSDYYGYWQSASLTILDIAKQRWECEAYTRGCGYPGKISFLFHDGYHRFQMGGRDLISDSSQFAIARYGIDIGATHTPFQGIAIQVDESHLLSELSRHLDRAADRLQTHLSCDRRTPYGSSLYQLLTTLCDLVENDGHEMVIENLENAIVSTLVQGPFHNYSQLLQKPAPKTSTSRAKEAADYIRANLKENLSLADIATAIQCSSRSLQATFASHYGCSPIQFLRNSRLEAAHFELIEGGKSVTEVAMEFGFSNPSRFSKAFQQRFGKRPSQVRC
ncbi:MAG: helix-turn-helix transcriptional regulator [Cyanobacteria bacterium SBLK]|nr:helix-turn-helix transcriptional regulator [Cyanobacteria bacterium SBLK]